MTMGALHEGHLALVREAQARADHVVVSVYVNPLQFGPGEDFEAYPRDLEADLALLARAGVDVVFAPTDAEAYPAEPLVRVDPGPVATVLEGRTRPGHFAGVLQIVCKVLNLVRPDLAALRAEGRPAAGAGARPWSATSTSGVEIVGVPIRREPDGLAMSSRNAYLCPAERERRPGPLAGAARGRRGRPGGGCGRCSQPPARSSTRPRGSTSTILLWSTRTRSCPWPTPPPAPACWPWPPAWAAPG